MEDLFEKTQETAQWLRSALPDRPEVGVILGTGLGGIADKLEVIEQIPFAEIPNFPISTAHGHNARLTYGTLANKRLFAMQGRYHFYEGHDFGLITLPVRVIKALGASCIVIISAAGGLNPDFRAGDPMLIKDHINLMGENPLRGLTDERLGERYPDMSRAYDPGLIKMAIEAAHGLGAQLAAGVYAAVQGPSLETPSETAMLRLLGADAVGMSTAPEVIVANQVGLKVLAFAAITNVNIPDNMAEISVEDVVANASLADPKIAAIVEKVVEKL
jgi:purine-nucleoside phosphorylase